MDHANLVLTFRLADDNRSQVRCVAGIKLDGRGGLSFYDLQSERNETIHLRQLEFFRLLFLNRNEPHHIRPISLNPQPQAIVN
jgi:hypothetical protein